MTAAEEVSQIQAQVVKTTGPRLAVSPAQHPLVVAICEVLASEERFSVLPALSLEHVPASRASVGDGFVLSVELSAPAVLDADRRRR